VLDNASELLQPGADDPDLPGQNRTPSPHRRALDAAAASLTMCRDLLQTDLASTPGGTRTSHSEWAAVVASPPIACAVLHELAGSASKLAAHGSHAAQTGHHAATGTRDDLNRANQRLWALDWAVEDAREQEAHAEGSFCISRCLGRLIRTEAPKWALCA
jgi:hypothetical protein